MYKWIEDETRRLGILSARPQVRPLTILTPDEYEALLGLGTKRRRICDVLIEKTRTEHKWGRSDRFLFDREPEARAFRLPGMEERYKDLVDRSLDRLRQAGMFENT